MPVTRCAGISSYVRWMESAPSWSVVEYGERDLQFHPHASVATPHQPAPTHTDTTRLSFISGSFGRAGATDVRERTPVPAREDAPPRSRWGVGYIAGVGPTELEDESPQAELLGTLPEQLPVLPPAPRDFRGLASLALATVILAVVGVAWSVTNSGRATVQTPVKPVPPPVQHAPSIQVPSSVTFVADTQPHYAPPAPVHHYVPAPRAVISAPAAQPPAPVVQPPTVPKSGDGNQQTPGDGDVGHHRDGAPNSDDEGH
jgi:hypothetical protein